MGPILIMNEVRSHPRNMVSSEDVVPEMARRNPVTAHQCFTIWTHYKTAQNSRRVNLDLDKNGSFQMYQNGTMARQERERHVQQTTPQLVQESQ